MTIPESQFKAGAKLDWFPSSGKMFMAEVAGVGLVSLDDGAPTDEGERQRWLAARSTKRLVAGR